MANTIVQFHSLPSLGTLALKLYPRTGGAIVNGASGDSMAEDADTPGLYQATVTEALSGIYAARVWSGSDLLGAYLVDLRNDTGAYDLADPAIAVGAGPLAAEEIGAEVEGGGGVEVTSFSGGAIAQLAGVTIGLSQPFRGPGVPLEIVLGDDYSAEDGRAIEIPVTGLHGDLELSGASAHLSLQLGSAIVTFEATDVRRVGDAVVVRFEPTAGETSGLRVSKNWSYDVQLTLSSGRKITPITGGEAHVLASHSP